MSQFCAINKCDRASRGLCDCCQQHLCLQHLGEHNSLLLSQLNLLTDEINALSVRFNILNVDEIICNSRRKLEQWRNDCYKQIDYTYEKKILELNKLGNEKIQELRNNLHEIHTKTTEFINSQETTRRDIDSLKSSIHQLEENMKNIETRCVTIHTRPLFIDETCVAMENSIEHELDVSTLSPIYKTICRSEESFQSIASNCRCLLMHRHPNLCLLDHNMNIIKEAPWSYGKIKDMCWSSKLDEFIVLESQHIFLVDEKTMSIKQVQTTEHKLLSCTCSDTLLFTSTNGFGSSIIEFSLVPKIEFVKEWKTPKTCAKGEIIDDIVYNDGKLALMIGDHSNKSVHIELRFSRTFDRVWSLQLGIKIVNNKAVRCCSLPVNEWLIMDYESNHFLQITKDGKLKRTLEYHPNAYRAILLDQNNLAVLTLESVNLHRIR